MRLLAVVCFSLMSGFIKLSLEHGSSVPEMMFYRSVFGLPPLLAWLIWDRNRDFWRTTRPMAHVNRSVIGVLSMALGFTAIGLLPLAEASTISFIAPLFALALSAPFLGERVGLSSWIAVALGFVGVIIVMQPGGELPLLGTLMALGSALGVSLVTVSLRSLSRTEDALTTVWWFTIFVAVATGVLMPWYGGAHDGWTWFLLVGVGVTGGVGQIGLTASLSHAPIAVLAPIDYLQLLLAVLLGWFLFDAQPAVTTWIGAGLIIASVLSTLPKRKRPEDIGPISATEDL